MTVDELVLCRRCGKRPARVVIEWGHSLRKGVPWVSGKWPLCGWCRRSLEALSMRKLRAEVDRLLALEVVER